MSDVEERVPAADEDYVDENLPVDGDLVSQIARLLESGPPEALAARLDELHASDVAELLGDFGPAEQALLFAALDAPKAGDVLAEIDADSLEDLLEHARPDRLRSAFAELEPDQAADVLAELEPEAAEAALAELEDGADIRALLEYPPDTAGGVMTTEFVVLRSESTVRQALDEARGGPESTHRDVLYVTDSTGRPVGRLPLAKLVFSPPESRVEDVMEADVHAVATDTDREQVAEIVRRYDLLSLPVVDPETGLMMGIVTVDDVLDVAADEAAEDMFRLAGTGATDPFHQPVWQRALLRLPWLVVTLGPGFLIGQVMRWLGYEPAGTTALLLFVPVMIQMAGNVSLQSSTIMVRGLATGDVRGHRTLGILVREIAVAALVGVVCGTIAGGVGYAFFGGRAPFALVTAASMLCGMVCAATTGTLIPLACHRVGVDPALASGPFVTSLNDLAGTMIYLGLGGALLEGLM